MTSLCCDVIIFSHYSLDKNVIDDWLRTYYVPGVPKTVFICLLRKCSKLCLTVRGQHFAAIRRHMKWSSNRCCLLSGRHEPLSHRKHTLFSFGISWITFCLIFASKRHQIRSSGQYCIYLPGVFLWYQVCLIGAS